MWIYLVPNHLPEHAMELIDRITVNPRQCGGRPCIRGMRIRVTDVLDLLASGLNRDQVLDELPDLERDDIEACLRFAARYIDAAFDGIHDPAATGLPRTGAELVEYWETSGVIGSRPEIHDSAAYVRTLREARKSRS